MCARTLFWLLVVHAIGCGRIGVEILPLPEPAEEEDGGGRDPEAGTDTDLDGGVSLKDAAANLDDATSSSTDAQLRDDASPSADAAGDANTATDTGGSGCALVDGSCAACELLAPTDSTCDGVDDDCSGTADEDYVSPMPQCGTGYCRTTSSAASCVSGVAHPCQPGAPRASNDSTLDGVDDDCDGQVDEDACATRVDTYRAGSFVLSPPPGCTTVNIKLWAGAGASGDGQAGFWLNVTGGNGGAGGYAEQTFTVTASTAMSLNVGGGGRDCPNAGQGGIAAHNGGAGGTGIAQSGSGGADGTRTGGAAGKPSSGGSGGVGSYGGGGGGAGSEPGFARHGAGGGGGAASVVIVGSVSVIAGGGGGGGGAGANIATAGFSGGDGGSGCSSAGLAPTGEGGGGGGGGVCQGATRVQAGTGRAPYDPSTVLPAGAARGGNASADCDPGGDGYAAVTYTR